jgi:hypothetical protein
MNDGGETGNGKENPQRADRPRPPVDRNREGEAHEADEHLGDVGRRVGHGIAAYSATLRGWTLPSSVEPGRRGSA